MAREIERKFLVKESWKPRTKGIKIEQGYLSTVPERTIRVRIKGNKGFLTVKGKNQGICRKEFEYEIPLEDAREMLKMAQGPVLAKTRYREKHGDSLWEIDVFMGVNEGLTVAEIELTEETSVFTCPEWLGKEVSDDVRYYNANLIKYPFSKWEK